MKRVPRTTLLHWLIAGAILMAGAAFSVLLLLPGRSGPAQRHKVSFLNAAGTVLQTADAAHGKAVLPPAVTEPGRIFRGWNADLFAIREDLSIKPLFTDPGDADNVFYADAVYAACSDRIAVTPQLGGTVNCTAFVLEVGYDSTLLTFDGTAALPDGLTADSTQPGLLRLRYDGDPLTGPMTLTTLFFRCTQNGSYRTTLPMAAAEISHSGGFTDSTAYDTTLYLLQPQSK